jgi:hypothetical protein
MRMGLCGKVWPDTTPAPSAIMPTGNIHGTKRGFSIDFPDS